MFSNFEPVVRTSVMKILAALYESGMVEEVAIADVLRLFGFTEDDFEVSPGSFSFQDEGWIEAYIEFKEHFDDEDLDEAGDEIIGEWNPQNLDSDGKLH